MIPPIPTPPTDNLYKFLAFSGLAILVAGGVYLVILADKDAALQNHIDAADRAQRSALEAYRAEASKVEDWFRKHPDTPLKDEAYWDRVSEDVEALKAEVAVLREWSDGNKTHLLHRKLCIYALWISGSVSACGFALWFRRVQRLQDQLLRYQVHEAAEKSKKPDQPG